MMRSVLSRNERVQCKYSRISGSAKGEWSERVGTPSEGTQNMTSVSLNRSKRSIQACPPNRVIDDVEPFPFSMSRYVFLYRGGAIIDRNGSEILHDLLFLRRHRGEYFCPERAGKLNRNMTDAAGPRLNQHGLTGVNLGAIHQPFPGSNDRQRKRGGLEHRKIPWFVCEQICIDCDKFRQRALQSSDASNHAVYLIADLECGAAGPCLFHRSCHVEAEHRWKRLSGMRCLARTNFGVEWIDTARRDSDQDLIHSRLREGKLRLPKVAAGSLN